MCRLFMSHKSTKKMLATRLFAYFFLYRKNDSYDKQSAINQLCLSRRALSVVSCRQRDYSQIAPDSTSPEVYNRL